MKKNTELILILISTISIVLFFLLTYKKQPFEYLKIYGETVKLEKNKYNYHIKINCETINNPNQQIIDYKLKKRYQNSKLSLSSELYNKNNESVKNYTDYNDISKIIFNINIESNDFVIEATC